MLFSKVNQLSRLSFGKQAEKMAKKYLKKQGYLFIEANYYTRDGEIDLIFKDGSTLVFVEVRAKRNLNFGSPEESIKPKKIMRCKKAAAKYLYSNDYSETECRFDVVAITYENKEWHIMHYKNTF